MNKKKEKVSIIHEVANLDGLMPQELTDEEANIVYGSDDEDEEESK